MDLSRDRCREVESISRWPSWGLWPLQRGMGGSPWRVSVASMLLCRTRRTCAEPVLRELLSRWSGAPELARAEGVEDVVRPLGLQRNRARQLTRFSSLYLGDSWSDLRELPGVGVYVADAVNVFCFGAASLEGTDRVLLEYLEVGDGRAIRG